MPAPHRVELAAAADDVLVRLVDLAVRDAAAAEVTRPAGAEPGWSPERVDWLRAFHRDRRSGLDGPLGEATWAVVVDGAVAGAVRLRHTGEPGTAETGIRLARSARGLSVASRALAAVVVVGRSRGLTELRPASPSAHRTTAAGCGRACG